MRQPDLKIDVSAEKWVNADWKLALTQYCKCEPGEYKRRLFAVIKRMAIEFTKRDFIFHSETYSDCAKQVIIEAMTEIIKHGMYFVPPHGEMVWNGSKSAIVKAHWHKMYHEEFSFLCAGKYCYGLIRFKEPKEITIKDFGNLKDKHKITEEERSLWWPKASRLFFAEIRDLFKFDKPCSVELPQGIQNIIRDVRKYFDAIEADPDMDPSVCLELPTPQEADKHLLNLDGQELAAYSIAENILPVRTVDTDYSLQLLFNHVAIHEKAEHALLETGKIPLEPLVRHSAIVGEMESRGMEHRVETTLDHDSPALDEKPFLKIKALGTRSNVEEWNSRHKKFTGVLLTAHGKRILLDCGNKSFLNENPVLVLLSHYHPDHFAWYDTKPKEPELSDLEDLQHTPIRTHGSTIYRHIMKFEHPDCEIFCEPFCGSASVLFSRKPVKTEVINDLNDDTIFALRFIKGLTKSELARLKKYNWAPNIDVWKRNRDQWKAKKFKDKVHRFYLYKYLSRYSFRWSGSEHTGPRVQAESQYNPDKLWRAKERLKGVKIYKSDYKDIMRMYDSPKTFMFLDPPYRQHTKDVYENEGLDWGAYYELVKSLKCKYIILNSNSKEDKAEYKRLGIKFHVAEFPGSPAYRISGGKIPKKKFICGANFELLKCKGEKKKKAKLPFKGSWDFEVIDDANGIEEVGDYEVPGELFISHPYSKCEVSKKAEEAGFNIEWSEAYEFDTFKFTGYPVEHSKLCPAVAWKIKVAGKTILFVPDVLEFDKEILKNVDIYIGDGSSLARDIKRKGNIGHMSVRHQIELVKKAGIPEIYFIHCGKEIIENSNPEKVSEFEKEMEGLGVCILDDGEEIKKHIHLDKPVHAINDKTDDKLSPQVDKKSTDELSMEDFDKQTILEMASDLSTQFSLEIEDFIEVVKEPPMPGNAQALIKQVTSLSREKLLKYAPDKLPKGYYVIQSHFRGNSNHFDLRIKANGNLEGETLLMQVAGSITEPVTTIEQAKAWSQKYHSDNASRWTKFHPGILPHEGIMVAEKGKHPLKWATKVKTIHEPGQAGASKEFPGVFYGEDWGIAYRTVIKPWFVETWLFGKWFNGAKLIERLLPATRKTERVGEKKVYWRGHISHSKSPPYIFSPAFFKNMDWAPEDSALPPHWEAIIPTNLRWWGKGLPKKQRIDLIKAAFNWLVEENFLKGEKKVLDEDDFAIILKAEKWSYVLHRIWWRGPAHVRYLPVSTWRLRLNHKDVGLLTFEFEGDPARDSIKGFTALRTISRTKPPGGGLPEDWLEYSGSIPAKHLENPNKELVARVVIESSGSFRLMSNSKDFLSGTFSGKKSGLKGYYIFERESSESDFWLFKKLN